MPSRRFLLCLCLAVGLGAMPLLPARAAAPVTATAQAAAFIRQSGHDLAAIVDSSETPEVKRQHLALFLDRVVDIPAVARFCLGRFWRLAGPIQQEDYVRLFHGILLDSVMARVGDYRGKHAVGMHVVIGRAETRGGSDIYVPTTVTRTGSPAAKVTWVVRMEAGGPRIVDLVAEGTSLRITVRADYASYLEQHHDSIPALLAAMRKQIASAKATGAAR